MPEPLRIAILGGARSIHTQRWARRLVAHGHTVQVYTLFPDVIPGVEVVNVYGHAIPGRIGVRRAWRRRKLRSLFAAFDPHLVQSFFLWPYGEWAAQSGVRPVVQGAWGSDVLVIPQRSAKRRRQIARMLADADAVTVNSASLAEGVVALGAERARVHEIGWGVDVNLFTGSGGGALGEQLGVAGRPIVVSPRGHKAIYNLDVLVEAMPAVLRQVPDAAFLFMGHGPMTDELRARMGELGVLDHARFRRFSENELPAAFAAASVAVSIPSSDSGRPTSLLEAMASRLPVVLSDVPASASWSIRGRAPSSFRCATPRPRRLQSCGPLQDPARREAYGARNRSVVTERANAADETAKCLALYRRLCN